MNQEATKIVRVLAIAPSARGFGYAVMENRVILECGVKRAKGDKNLWSLSKIERLMKVFQPGVLVLQDMNAKGSRRAPRIKELHERIVALGGKQGRKVRLVSEKRLRMALLGDVNGTKHEMAQELARRFPTELSRKLPPKRRPWDSEDARMDMFVAAGLAVVPSGDRK